MKRTNGHGTIEPRDGRFRVRVVVEGKRRQLGVFDTEAKAAGVLAAWLRDRGDGEIEAPGSITLYPYGVAWLDQRELHGSKRREKVRSVHTERSAWNTHVQPSEIGSMPIANITARDMEKFARWLRGRTASQTVRRANGVEVRPTSRPLSRSSQKHALRLVRDVLKAAIPDGIIAVNPAALTVVAAGGPRAKDLSDQWLRDAEIGQLIAASSLAPWLRAAYACAIGLALRKSDLIAVRVDDVCLDDRHPFPHVRVWIGKTEKWHRVPVMPWLLPILAEHAASMPPTGYLFGHRDGTKRPNGYDFRWPEKRQTGAPTLPSALHRAGVDRRIRFHDLRGTTATHLALGTWGRRWSLQEIQEMLAHSDQRVTERYVKRAWNTLSDAAASTPGCPRLPPTISESATPPGGIEPPTVRLEGGIEALTLRVVAPRSGQRGGNALRAQLVASLETGSVPRALLDEVRELAEADPLVRAVDAMRDATGGPHEVRRAADVLDLLSVPHHRGRRAAESE
jgi:integrase